VFMETLHHRMPVVLDAATGDEWLAGSTDLLSTWKAPKLRAWPVNRRVNNARNESEDLIDPAGEQREG